MPSALAIEEEYRERGIWTLTCLDEEYPEHLKERLGALGVEAVHSNPQQFGAFLSSENETWGKLIKEAGISGIQ